MLDRTIAAASTPPGKGGVALIRISGDDALRVASRVFRSASGRAISDYPVRTQIYGYVMDADERVDDVLLTYFRAPASYTGEDTVEITCHGGTVVTRTVLELVFSAGATPAEAGEFTRRAFINGKVTLTEAEAIGDLLDAQSREQIRLLSSDSRGALGREIEAIRLSLLDMMSSIYARIDYPDEDLGDLTDAELLARLRSSREHIGRLMSTYKTGRAVSEGISTVICGKPNVGKSSLYNILLGEDAAIVTDIEGTTRDVLTRTAPIGKVMLRLADTAGIRDGEGIDAVERIGIEKSRKMMSECDLLFAIFDISREFGADDDALIESISGLSSAKVALLNKCDAALEQDLSRFESFDAVIRISAKDDPIFAREEIARVCEQLFTDEKIIIGRDAVVSSARQYSSLASAYELISLAEGGMADGFGQDAVSSDIERALGAVSELCGKSVNEQITADIFSKFCVGK